MVGDPELMALMRAIAVDESAAARRLAASPELATIHVKQGATRQTAPDFFLDEISHHIYASDTALHIAAASRRADLAQLLIASGADIAARNRRGAQPLHYAADGGPHSNAWNPAAQAATITFLIKAGADPNALDKSGVAPLHRAVRNRSAAAVAALLDGGADADLPNGSGSTPMMLAVGTTGKGGSGSPESKAEQVEIIRLLEGRSTN